MRYRSAVLLTIWTALIGPVFAMPSPGAGAHSAELIPLVIEEKKIELPKFEQVFKAHR